MLHKQTRKDLATRDVSICPQGCQMVYFQTKNPNLGKFWRVFQWNVLVYFKSVHSFAVYYGHLVYFLVIWYIFPVLVCCCNKNLATLLSTLLSFANRGQTQGRKQGV
jgi:hypothetical protein